MLSQYWPWMSPWNKRKENILVNKPEHVLQKCKQNISDQEELKVFLALKRPSKTYHISHATFQYFIASLLTLKNSIACFIPFILRNLVTRLKISWKPVLNYCYCLLTPFNFTRFLKMSQSSASASSWILKRFASQQKMSIIPMQSCYLNETWGSAKNRLIIHFIFSTFLKCFFF